MGLLFPLTGLIVYPNKPAHEFGPDNNLYITSEYTEQVLRYDGATGAFIDVFDAPSMERKLSTGTHTITATVAVIV